MKKAFVLVSFLIVFISSCQNSVRVIDRQNPTASNLEIDNLILETIYTAQLLTNTTGPRLDSKQLTPSKFSAFMLQPKELPDGEQYILYRVNMALRKIKLGEYYADRGQLFSLDNHENLENLIHLCNNHMNGEWTACVLVPKGKTKSLAALLTPIPIRYQWDDGAHISLFMLTPDAYFFSLCGSGFEPNEKLVVCSKSGGEVIEFEHNASADGRLYSGHSPAVLGKKGGVSSLSIRRANSTQIGKLKYNWGDKAIQTAGQ